MSYWQINNQVLHANLSQSNRLSTLVPKDEFWQGMTEYTVDFIFKVFDKSDKNFVVGMRDTGNFYDFHFYNNQLIVEDIRLGNSLHSASVPFALTTNKDYSVHLFYSKEKIELLIDGQLVFATDKFWSPPIYGGKFGLKIATGSVAQSHASFDQIEIKELANKDVLFKQNDPLWGEKIYDHADLWSKQPAMSNWACALSSGAMLLRHYGFQFLENGEELNPWSLNQWLLSQADGYIANGLVNWLAISRLSAQLSKIKNDSLPKLEFTYFKASEAENMNVLRENLNDDLVQIAASTKHFFLVKDYLEETHDFLIKDPLYDYTLLTKSVEKIDSLRLFKPSFTDLSYILLVIPKKLHYSLADSFGKEITNFNLIEESIVNGEENIGQDYDLLYYPKPNAMAFNLLLSANFDQELLSKTKLYFYQQDGTVQSPNLIELLGKQDLSKLNQIVLKINYAKEQNSEVNLELIEKTIDELRITELDKIATQSKADFENGEMSFYIFYQLNLLIKSLREHLDYYFLLEKFLDFYQL